MNDDIIYNSNVICLFVENFNNIKKKYNSNSFDWTNYEKIFYYIFNKLSDDYTTLNDFIKYYYFFTFLYLNYTNYLVFINHPDIKNIELEKIVNNIKTSPNIVKKLLKFSFDENVYKIIKLNDIFLSSRIKNKKVDKTNIQKYINEYVYDLKQFDKISSLPNNNYKKILNLIIYRYAICKKNNFNNYHELYLKKIIGKKNFFENLPSYIDFENFQNQIPNLKNILNININYKSNYVFEISVNKLLNFIISKYDDGFYYEDNQKHNYIIITNNKYRGQIKINLSDKFENIEFNQYQTDYSFLHYNIKELEEFNFLKKTFTNIEINIFDILKDLSSVLEFIHLILSSIKIISSSPSDIYECLYIVDYSNYYFNTFCYFLEFIKKEVNNNYYYNKFIIDVIKFLYIYSYYDYYFYYSNDFVDALINNHQYKNNMFLEFTNGLKKILKLPQELNNFPPFFTQEYDINAIIYYNFEIPSYFKLYDFMNAIYNVFEIKKSNNKINIYDLISNNIFFDNQSDYLISNNKSINMGINNITKKKNYSDINSLSNIDISTSSEDNNKINNKSSHIRKELETNLDSEIINLLDDNELTHMENINAYVELNYKNKNENFLFDTET